MPWQRKTILFNYGKVMSGKHIGLIVLSASSGISNVVMPSASSPVAIIEENQSSGIMSLYTPNGQKVSACSAPSVFRQAKQGCYIGRFKRGVKYVAAKIIK